ncbi:MAG: HEPN domain-containing protein [bacterium]|nr:HEPN domain-containing protein [bacterium]
MASTAQFDDEMARRVVDQMMDLFVRPEIDRRKATGRISDDFELRAAQVVLNVDASPQVRLNDEVRIAAKYRAAGPMKKGEKFPIDPKRIVRLVLTDEDPNAAHITLLGLPAGGWVHWVLEFDFHYNATRTRAHAEAAREFLDTARDALDKGHLRTLVENLYGATELMAKGILLSIPDKVFMTTGSHRLIAARFDKWGDMGNVDKKYAKLLTRLWGYRGQARYLRGNFKLTAEKAREMLATAEEMFAAFQQQIPERIRPQ